MSGGHHEGCMSLCIGGLLVAVAGLCIGLWVVVLVELAMLWGGAS